MPSAMPSPEPVLETARLILRVPQRGDFEAWAALDQDEETMRHLGGVLPRFSTWKNMLGVVGSWHVLGFGPFSVIRKSDARWIGRVGPLRYEGWPGAEIGWTLAREAWGNGFATEAATAAVDWVFDVAGWDDVIHCIAPDNTASQAVAMRIGSGKRGLGRLPVPYDDRPIDIWGQTRAQWLARRDQHSS